MTVLEFGTGLRARIENGTEIEATVLEPDGAAASLIALLPAQTAYLFGVLPLGFVEDRPRVAISDPDDELGMACVRSILGEDVEFVHAEEEQILAALSRAYNLTI